MRDLRVKSWAELNERLYEDSWKETLGRFRSDFAFRGMADAGHDLRASLKQLGEGFEQKESHLLRNFRKYARQGALREDTIWNWLALGQHHDLPTRVFDWTYSPYVALHFATADLGQFGTDGAVWCIDYVKVKGLLPREQREVLDEGGSNVFTVEMLARAADSLAEFDDLADEEFVVFFEPPSFDERITNQFALFSLMSSPTARLDEWLADRPELARRILIPAGLKREVRDKLDQANVTERVLFPGLDGLSHWLTRYYTSGKMPHGGETRRTR